MANDELKVGARVVYYAEGQPYRGPFPALVDAMTSVEDEDKPRLSLRVFFNGFDHAPTVKTGVAYSFEPQKFHWGFIPSDWTWPEPVKE